MNGDDSSGKVTKRDTSENDRNRKAYRSGTVSSVSVSHSAGSTTLVHTYIPAALRESVWKGPA